MQNGSVPEQPVGVTANCRQAETQLGAKEDDPDVPVAAKGAHWLTA